MERICICLTHSDSTEACTGAGGAKVWPPPRRANSPELKAILDDEAKQYPLWAWGLLMPMTGYTLGYSFIKNAIKNGDDCQPWSFWLWYVTPVPVLGGFMIATAWILGRRHKRRVAAGYQYLEADMQWDVKTLQRFPKTALLAGVTAGLLGIGGGMVIGPLFLSIGMEPQVPPPGAQTLRPPRLLNRRPPRPPVRRRWEPLRALS